MLPTVKQHKNLLPILLLAVLCVYTVYDVLVIRQWALPDNIKYGVAAVVTSLAFYFFERRYFKYPVIVTIVLGLLGVLEFSLTTFHMCFAPLCFQTTPFVIGLLYIFLNLNSLRRPAAGKTVIDSRTTGRPYRTIPGPHLERTGRDSGK